MNRQAGTTLIELVIAIVVIAIAASAVIMALSTNITYSADPMIRHQAVASSMPLLLLFPITRLASPTRHQPPCPASPRPIFILSA